MFQIVCTIGIFLLLVIPTGSYLFKIATNAKTFADPVCNRLDGCIYKICGIDRIDMSWKRYGAAFLLTNAFMLLAGYLLLRLQSLLFLNPNGIAAMPPDLAFNTTISFMTNTNLQHYSGESGLSYLSQMAVITFMMFTSAASGYAVCMAFIRGLAGKAGMGNFYVDLVRIITRVLLPIAILVSILLITQGVPQTLQPNATVQTIEGKFQDIAMGPIASLEAIKHLGTNGGGFLGANSSTPLENPTAVSNLIEILCMMLLPGASVLAFGKMVHATRQKQSAVTYAGEPKKVWFGAQGKTVFAVMSLLFLLTLSVCFFAEKAGNPALMQLGVEQGVGSMEGKEVRFGTTQSALFTTVTTSFTTGSVNNMHDTLTPLGGMAALLNMMLNVVFGGKGVGLMNMLLYAILTVFLCGLMIGRTPEYLGKKIEGYEMKLCALGILVHPLLILCFSALAVCMKGGLEGITNPGFHGLSQVLYEFASSSANNGSGFEGLADNNVFWNISTGLVMFFGRYLPIVLQLAIAGSLMRKRPVNESVGTLKTDTATFAVSMFAVVLIFAALTFFPVLALGPVAEHLTLWN